MHDVPETDDLAIPEGATDTSSHEAPAPDEALNALETALNDTRAARLPAADFYLELAGAQISVPSAHEVEPDGRGLRPVTFDNNGVKMVAAFTDPSRIEAKHRQLAPYVLEVNALWFIKSMPADHGLVLFSGADPFAIEPDALATLRAAN